MPIEFPLPEQSVIFASVKSPYDLQIMLDAPMNSEDLMVAYTQKLEETGWMLKPDNVQGGVQRRKTYMSFVMINLKSH